jgi:hypothetical protein
MAQAATANGHTHGGPDHKHTSKCNHPAPVYAKGFNENALTIQKIIGVINAVLGVTILLNPEYVTGYMLKGAPMEVQMFALISMLGATQLFAGVLIMSGMYWQLWWRSGRFIIPEACHVTMLNGRIPCCWQVTLMCGLSILRVTRQHVVT